MNLFTQLIHQTGLNLTLLVGSGSAAMQANWMENLVIGMLFILGAAFVLQGAWNGLLTEFPRIGRLSYFRAVHMIAVFGVFMSLVWFIFF